MLATNWYVPKQYQAEVTLLTMDKGLGGVASSMMSAFGSSSSQFSFPIQAILKSRSLAKNVIENEDLKTIVCQKNWDSEKKQWIGQEPDINTAASILNSAVKIEQKDLLSIIVTWNDPKIAAKLANDYAKNLIIYLNQKAIGANLQILDEALPPSNALATSDRKSKVVVGLFIGFFAGVFIALLLENSKKIIAFLAEV